MKPWFLMALVLALGACGPELTEPGKTNVAGRWVTADAIPNLSTVVLDLVQGADAAVTGSWSGTAQPGVYGCTGTQPCPLKPALTGSNTVLEVRLELTGAGTFTGQVEGATMKGDLLQNTGSVRIQFTRTP